MKNVLDLMGEPFIRERLESIIANNGAFRGEEAKTNLCLNQLEKMLNEEQNKKLTEYTGLQNNCDFVYAMIACRQGMADILNFMFSLVVEK